MTGICLYRKSDVLITEAILIRNERRTFTESRSVVSHSSVTVPQARSFATADMIQEYSADDDRHLLKTAWKVLLARNYDGNWPFS